MRRRFAWLLVSAFGPLTVTACVAANFDGQGNLEGTTGGELVDAAAGLTNQSTPKPTSTFAYTPLTPGNTWTALYTDYFGAPQALDGGGFTGGRAACSGTAGACHGSSDSVGAAVSGYVCAGDPTDAGKDDCWASLTSSSVSPMLLAPGTPFVSDGLYQQLNSVDNPSGLMPAGQPDAYKDAGLSYVFSQEDLARLSDWVDAGFPNN